MLQAAQDLWDIVARFRVQLYVGNSRFTQLHLRFDYSAHEFFTDYDLTSL
jgi:hypothetical protein